MTRDYHNHFCVSLVNLAKKRQTFLNKVNAKKASNATSIILCNNGHETTVRLPKYYPSERDSSHASEHGQSFLEIMMFAICEHIVTKLSLFMKSQKNPNHYILYFKATSNDTSFQSAKT